MKKCLNILDLFILCSLFLFTAWVPLQALVLHIDGAARLPNTMIYASAVLVLFFYSDSLKKYWTPILVWLVWIIYNVINTAFKTNLVGGTWSIPFFTFLLGGKLTYCMVLLAMLERHRDLTLKIIFWALWLGCTLFLMFGEIRLHGSNEFERLMTTRLNANEIALSGTVLSVISIYFLLKKTPSFVLGGLGVITALMLITYAASRTAFVGLAAAVAFGVWGMVRRKVSPGWSMILLVLLLAMFALPAWRYIQDNTVVGARFMAMDDEISRFRMVVQDGWISKILGERSIYYYDGIDIWKRAPWSGIGFNNFILFSTYGTVCHIEYMAQLSEGGIIGFAIYLLFLLLLIRVSVKAFWSSKNTDLPEQVWSGAVLCVLLLIQVGAFVSMKTDFYTLCACVLYASQCCQKNQDDKKNSSGIESVNLNCKIR